VIEANLAFTVSRVAGALLPMPAGAHDRTTLAKRLFHAFNIYLNESVAGTVSRTSAGGAYGPSLRERFAAGTEGKVAAEKGKGRRKEMRGKQREGGNGRRMEVDERQRVCFAFCKNSCGRL